MSIFIFQSMFALAGAVIFAGGLFNDSNIFPDNPTLYPFIFGVAVLFFALA